MREDEQHRFFSSQGYIHCELCDRYWHSATELGCPSCYARECKEETRALISIMLHIIDEDLTDGEIAERIIALYPDIEGAYYEVVRFVTRESDGLIENCLDFSVDQTREFCADAAADFKRRLFFFALGSAH